MNAPERAASFLLDEDTGETKIVYTSDTKVSSTLVARNAIESPLFEIVQLSLVYSKRFCSHLCCLLSENENLETGHKCRYIPFQQGRPHRWKLVSNATLERSLGSICWIPTPASSRAFH